MTRPANNKTLMKHIHARGLYTQWGHRLAELAVDRELTRDCRGRLGGLHGCDCARIAQADSELHRQAARDVLGKVKVG